MRAGLRSSLIAALAVAGLLAACTNAAGPIDGWWLGHRIDCSSVPCARYFAVAEAGLDRREPGHAPIVESVLRAQPRDEPDDGSRFAYSGGEGSVVVFTLADGSTRAIGVDYAGISNDPVAFHWGPALHGEPPVQSTEP